MGLSTSIVVLGNKLAPGVGDHYLAANGFDSQMTDEPEDPDRPSNLWEPAPGDYAAHGRFDDRARDASLQLRMVTNRLWDAGRNVRDWVAGKVIGV